MVNVDGRTIHFGATGYQDFTTHKDPKRKTNYLARHSNENWNDPKTAGFWAKWLLWNQRSLADSIRDTERRFNIKTLSGLSVLARLM